MSALGVQPGGTATARGQQELEGREPAAGGGWARTGPRAPLAAQSHPRRAQQAACELLDDLVQLEQEGVLTQVRPQTRSKGARNQPAHEPLLAVVRFEKLEEGQLGLETADRVEGRGGSDRRRGRAPGV